MEDSELVLVLGDVVANRTREVGSDCCCLVLVLLLEWCFLWSIELAC